MPLSASRFFGQLRANPALAALESGVASSRGSELVVIHRLFLGYCHVRPGMNSGDISVHHLELLVTDRCVCLQGFVKNYQALVVCRFILGFFEAGGLAYSPHDSNILANTLKVSSRVACTSYPAGM